MARNALDVARDAVAKWRSIHGNESLYNQCQRYDGYYWQWAWAGNEQGIITYSSAAAAANASSMYTTDPNAAGVGHLVYWNWGQYGHVGTVIGNDGGRTLCTHTGTRGDTLMSLGNHVKVSHADSLGLGVRGVSTTNGRNRARTGMDPYVIGSVAGGGGGGQTVDLRAGWAWYTNDRDAVNERNPHGPKWTGERLALGIYPVIGRGYGGAIQIRANDGSAIWISPKAAHLISGGGGGGGGGTGSQIDLRAGWAWYTNDRDAVNERNPHGPKWTGERLALGIYPVIGRGYGGAIQIRANDGSAIWISPKAAHLIS